LTEGFINLVLLAAGQVINRHLAHYCINPLLSTIEFSVESFGEGKDGSRF